LGQAEPVDEYGRALYAVSRSVLGALLDQLGHDDLVDLTVTGKTSRFDSLLRSLDCTATRACVVMDSNGPFMKLLSAVNGA
jgi:hypothetical protein